MGFKMKGPSTHKGTKIHTMEVDFSNNSPAEKVGYKTKNRKTKEKTSQRY